MSRVSVTFENHIARVRLTRADKMNAVDHDTIAAVIAAGEEVAASNARACVISGEGRAFCAGTDISALGQVSAGDPTAPLLERTHGDGTTNAYQEFALIWRRVPIPVIAALHGPVFGAGCQLALGADIRIAGPDTKMAMMEARWGLVPDMGGMVLLPGLVRPDVLRHLTFTGAPVDVDLARAWGMITQKADDPLTAADALATDLALKSPSGLRAAKRLIHVAETAPANDVLLAESREQGALLAGAEHREMIAAGMEKRAPVFK